MRGHRGHHHPAGYTGIPLGVHDRRIYARVYPSEYNEQIASFEAFAAEA